ncbi:unnamed protein product [Durusdinium trenchii]|uniref:Uncharacterized protein n=1 Tax=Durusdinium trenchii TaxID=1381693 RepID=A0ABP0JH69_9DINO
MGAACSEVEDAEAPERGAKSTSLEEWRRHRFEKNPEFCSFDQLARPLNVLRDGILARKDNEPVLLVGPVLGRVTDTSASFLVEVSEEIDVNISIVQVNGFRGPLDRHVYPMGTSQDFQQPSLVSLELDRTFFSPKSAVCCVQRLKPGMPVTFQLQNLLSDSPYMVFVSNIPDLELRNPLRFRTMPLRVERLRLVAIGDYAASNFGTMAGEDSEEGMDPWRELLKTVKAGAAEPHVALHLGRNSATHLFEEVMDSLKEHQSYCEGPKQTMLRRARDLLRESYRTTLGGHRQLRAILAQLCSNICVFMPPLELPKILEQIHELETKAKQTGAEVTLLLGDLHQLLCLALEVYQEYERAMWDGSFHLSLDYLRLGRGWLHTPLPMVSHEPEPASTEYIVDAGEISDSVEEWHIHRYGSVTIMVLDTKGHAITAALTGTKSKQILSEKQWDAIEEVLADEVAQVLLFVSELPLALEESEARRSLFHENSAEVLHEDGTALDHPLRHGRWTMSWDMAAGIWDGHGHDSRQVVKKASKGSFEKGLGEDAKDSGHVAVNATDMGSKGSLKGFGEDAEDSGHVALSKTDKGSKGSLEKGLREDAESSGHVVLNKTDKGSKGSLEKGVGENAEESEHVALNATDMGSKGSLEKGLGEGAENSGHVVLNKTDKGSKGQLGEGL